METEQNKSASTARGCAGLPSHADVLVVGCGPVGAAAAKLLGSYGLSVLVVDKATDIFMAPRAIALDNEALRILQLVGVGEEDFDKVAIPRVSMRSPVLGEFGRVNTLGGLDGHPKLVTFYQPDLERCLRTKLRRLANVQLALGVTLTNLVESADHVVASLTLEDGQQRCVRAQYVVGADGASSRVRELIGQAFRGRTFRQDWLIVDARNVPHPIDHVEFVCDHRRPTPHMTAPGGRERWEFMLRRGETRENMESEARVRELLAPWGDVDRMVIERKAVYRFHARTVDTFSKGRIFLAGDAAHITPPFAGQGLVAGLRDAANLSWKLAWVIDGRASPRILDSYDQERRPHVKAMIGLARFMGNLVMPRNGAAALFVHGLLRLARGVPRLRAQFDELGIKPKNAFRRGLFVQGRSAARLVRGALLPQGWVRGADGFIGLSDEALGKGIALVGFGIDAASALDAHAHAELMRSGGAIVNITYRGQFFSSPHRCWEDLHGAFLPGVAPAGWVAIVRPDRTVMSDGPATEVNRLVLDCLALLETGAAEFGQASFKAVAPSA
jgi:3-(3-hydroxy-phenyl)propionate hydroxylase